MASVTFLLCCGLLHGATTETPLRKRVIESFIGELAEKPLDDPRFIQILEVILDKVEETEAKVKDGIPVRGVCHDQSYCKM